MLFNTCVVLAAVAAVSSAASIEPRQSFDGISSTVPSLTDAARMTVLNDHNAKRATVPAAHLAPLQYDLALECIARKWLDESKRQGRTTASFMHASQQWWQANFPSCIGYSKTGITAQAFTDAWYYLGENMWGGNITPDPQWPAQIPGAVASWTDFRNAYYSPASDGTQCSERETYAATNNDIKAIGTSGYTLRPACSNFGQSGHFSQVMWGTTKAVGCAYDPAIGTVCNYFPPGNFPGQPYAQYS